MKPLKSCMSRLSLLVFSFIHLLLDANQKFRNFLDKSGIETFSVETNLRDRFSRCGKKLSTTCTNGGVSWNHLHLKLIYIHFWAQIRLLITMICFLNLKYCYFLDSQKFNPLFKPLIQLLFKYFCSQNLACISGYRSAKIYRNRNNIDKVMDDIAISLIYFETNYNIIP